LDNWGYVNGKLTSRADMTESTIENKEVDWVKDIYKTFKEINQLELVKQAGIRQQYVDQSVSLNLAFPTQALQNGLIKFIWKLGNWELKLYII
jgi:ribonucleotide reductase alpha subunit